jgi:hypothetical protein
MGSTGATAGACEAAGADAGTGASNQAQAALATTMPPTKARALPERGVTIGTPFCEGR